MSAIDSILNTARSNEQTFEHYARNPLGLKLNLPIPPGPAGVIQRIRQGKSPIVAPKTLNPISPHFPLPLRPSVTAQTPANVKVIGI